MLKRIFLSVLVLLLLLCCLIISDYSTSSTKIVNIDDSELSFTSAKQILSYLETQSEIINQFAQCNVDLGEIKLIHRGKNVEVIVLYSDGNEAKPLVIQAKFQSEYKQEYELSVLGKNTKLYPGTIDVNHYKIDSVDAVNKSEMFFTQQYNGFRYDDVIVRTSGKIANKNWSVLFIDRNNRINYYSTIDAINGDILSNGKHSF